jgi:hypothetical protein
LNLKPIALEFKPVAAKSDMAAPQSVTVYAGNAALDPAQCFLMDSTKSEVCGDAKVANRDIKGLAPREREWLLNDGQIQNASVQI